MSLQGKVAIVTGGGQGIGKAAARQLLAEGMSVVIAEIDQEAGRETQDELSATGTIIFEQCDSGNEPDARRVVDAAVSRFQRIDAIVNNTGIGRGKPVTNLTLDEWNRVLATNLTSIFLFAKHGSPHLAADEGGAMVNIASTRALMSEKNTEAYSASKGGVVAISHALSVSLGPAVRVNCISPGWIETGPWKKQNKRREAQHSDEDRLQHPAGRVGQPQDIAQMIAFLLDGERSGFITGQNFVIDGGMTKKMIYV
jgi:NAD(P)-dependent dehydrogenase (short-subunit alcohol dehydrogenase family)